jgi:bacillithiol biosynthesis deacetylase BshB1
MNLDILAFGAHPDDVEISMGGTILHYVNQGKKVGLIDITEGELGTRGTVETRYAEAKESSLLLGIHLRHNLQMKDGFFQHNEESLKKIIQQIRRLKPEIIFANSIVDRHPDHARAAKLVAEAAFLSGLSKIHTDWEGESQTAHRPRLLLHYIQDYLIEPNILFDVTPYMTKKVESIKCYKTQFYDPNSAEPNTPISGKDFLDFLTGRMREFGRPINAEFAEGFTCNKLVGVTDLFNLK